MSREEQLDDVEELGPDLIPHGRVPRDDPGAGDPFRQLPLVGAFQTPLSKGQGAATWNGSGI